MTKTFVFYIFFQVIAYAVEFLSFLSLVKIFDVNALLSNVVSKVLAAVTAFFCHKLVTFSAKGKSDTLEQAIRYSVAILFNMLFSTLLLNQLLALTELPVQWVKIISDVIAVLLSFYITKKFVFRN